MSSDFKDYNVLGIVDSGAKGSCYRVEEKNSGRNFVWEAVDYGLLSAHGKTLLNAEVKKLQALSHPHLIRCFNEVEQKETCILYLVKEYCTGSVASLVKKCRSTNSFVFESFVWRILYQAARAAQACYTWGAASMQLDLTPAGVHLDEDGNVRLDYWFEFREEDAVKCALNQESLNKKNCADHERKKLDTRSLGYLVYELTTLRPPTPHLKKQPNLPPQYSEDLRKLITVMMSSDSEKRPTIEGILYHPALVSHLVKGSFQQIVTVGSSESASVSSESTVDSCPKCQDFEQKNFLLKKRENNVRDRELELKTKEVELRQKQKRVALLERQTREKMARAEVYLGQIKRTREVGLGSIVNQIKRPDDLDSSSYSADPGDTSLLPTAAKLDPSKITRPASFAPSVSSRRSVRFETIPEVEEPAMYNKECKTWLQNKRMKFKALKKKRGRAHYDKENQIPPMNDLPGGSGLKSRKGSVSSLPCSTIETQDGILETFFSLKL